jgi:hypothetical protein
VKKLLLLTLLSSPLFAKETICETSPVPPDCVIIQRNIPAGDCGQWESHVFPPQWTSFTKVVIDSIEGKDEMTICEDQTIPQGFVIIRHVPSAMCGNWRQGLNTWANYGAEVIRRLK